MKSIRIIYHLARADFYERVRRYSFLVMLGLVVFLGYQVAIGNMTLSLGQYRGEFNSAWVGAMMSLIATFFIGWFGFYVVKGAVARDRETGVGQIMATTPLTRPLYLLGKWLSNFAVLMAMVAVLALAGIVIQLMQGENMQVNLIAFLTPFFFIVMPLMAFVAAVAVLFESIPFLQGGFGNIVYFIAFIMFVPLFMENQTLKNYPAYEPMGLGLLASEMGKAVTAVYPDYDGSFTLGSDGRELIGTFTWTGINWTPEFIFARFSIFALAIILTLLASLFFDRFDPSRSKPKRMKSAALLPTLEVDPAPRILSTPHLTPLNTSANRFNFPRVLLAELKLMLKGQRWWWYLIAIGLIIACLANDAQITREFILPIAWIWHVLVLSALGNRESHHNVQQMTFSSASPLWRQLPAQWLAGFIVTLLMGSGAALNFIINGDMTAMLSLIAGAIFIPSLALALGVWSGTSKVFEVVYVTLWYIGPLNRVPPVDFTNASGAANPMVFILTALALIIFAAFGRARQLRN
jgi:hypothetical protein